MSKSNIRAILLGILAILLGWVVGSAVNLGLIQIGHALFPIEGLDASDMDALADVMSTLGPQFFLFPFLAHALGTLVGALVASLIAVTHKMRYALAIGLLFLAGGIAVNMMIPGPLWFTVVDLIFAYIPMAWLGGKLVVCQT